MSTASLLQLAFYMEPEVPGLSSLYQLTHLLKLAVEIFSYVEQVKSTKGERIYVQKSKHF